MTNKKLNMIINELKNNGYDAEITSIRKGNENIVGIKVKLNDNIFPVIYPDENMTAKENAKYFINIIKEQFKSMNTNEYVNNITKWENCKDKLILCVEPHGENKPYLTFQLLDIDIYVRCVVDDESSFRVTEQMIDTWGIEFSDFIGHAVDNTERSFVYGEIIDIMYGNYYGINDMSHIDTSWNMIVVTNNDFNYGASILAFPYLLNGIADKFNSDLYVIPSSIHEAIVVPAGMLSYDDVKSIIRDVNKENVEDKDVLGTHPYVYHKKSNTISIAE